jgi:hypothetical protein
MSAKPTSFIRDLAEYVTRGVLLFEAISIGRCDVPGFFYLESRFRLNPGEQPATYTEFELSLHESQFERV